MKSRLYFVRCPLERNPILSEIMTKKTGQFIYKLIAATTLCVGFIMSPKCFERRPECCEKSPAFVKRALHF